MQHKKRLTLGSLFDGSGGFPLGGALAGIEPVWASEIEPFPIRVTTKRLPFMRHFGDISTLDGHALPPVDIITFGSPCQDMSIAGKRAGLDGDRSGLFHQAIRIIKEMREATNSEKPRYIVWENVPGAFSSNKGEDFRCVLESICQVKDPDASVPMPKKWQHAGSIVGRDYSVAWRLFDAQYWGVPQRRKRIYLVADFGGERANNILFESEGVSGYTPQGFRSWQGAAACVESGTGETSYGVDGYNGAISPAAATLGHQDHYSVSPSGNAAVDAQGGRRTANRPPTIKDDAVVVEHHPQDSRIKISDKSIFQTLPGNMGQSPTTNVPLLLKIRSGCEGGKPSCNHGGTAVVALEGNGARPSHQGNGYSEDGVSFTLNAVEKHAVAYGIDRAAYNQGKNAQFDFTVMPDVAPPSSPKGPEPFAPPHTQQATTLSIPKHRRK